MKPTFRRLREHLLHPQVKELLNLYNKLYPYDRRTIHRIWQRNYHEFIELLDDLDILMIEEQFTVFGKEIIMSSSNFLMTLIMKVHLIMKI